MNTLLNTSSFHLSGGTYPTTTTTTYTPALWNYDSGVVLKYPPEPEMSYFFPPLEYFEDEQQL